LCNRLAAAGRMKTTLATLWGAVAAACVVEPQPVAAPYEIAVAEPPPQPMAEAQPMPRDPRAIWISGYWHWTGLQYTWIPGHWEIARTGVQWLPPRYVVRDGVYYYVPGGWRR
jgi:YXWGXW repeat-containing protein